MANPRLSSLASALVGSEILKIAGEVRALSASGQDICNLTVGDFSPAEFRIPPSLEQGIVDALRAGETNYPPSDGLLPLREAVRALYGRMLGFTPALAQVIVTGGARPGIYATYRTLVDAGDRVIYPTPSWNNNHYTHLVGGEGVPVATTASASFMPTRAALEPLVRGARLLALCSPLNPSGTMFTRDGLREICELVVEENARRGTAERPLYLLYDQVYWMLTFGSMPHVHPLEVCPSIAPYVIYIDGISKSLAATGVRVGWVVAPVDVAFPMSGFLGHVGAWAPRAEQRAVATLLGEPEQLHAYHERITHGLRARLDALHAGFVAMRDAGLPVETIAPAGAIYLSVRFNVAGRRTSAGTTLRDDEAVRAWLLQEAGVAVVPFQAFGVQGDTGWYRLSVGAVSLEQIARAIPRVRAALGGLSPA